MEQSFFRNKTVKFVIRLITALSFVFFTAFQFYVAMMVEEGRVGRFISVCIYLVLMIASLFAFSKNYGLVFSRTVLLDIGLLVLFVIRLLNIPTLFGSLDFSDTTSVLSCLKYLLAQFGTLFLAVGTLLFMIDDKINKNRRNKNKFRILFATVIGVLYAACFVIECVLLIKYGVNIELSLKASLISRVFYFCGFFGTAVVSVLPPTKTEKEPKQGQFLYSEDNEDQEEVDIII